MYNKLAILTTTLTILSTQCLAESISIAEIKKQYQKASTNQSNKEKEEAFKYYYFGLGEPQISFLKITKGENGHNFMRFTTEIKFINNFYLYCRYDKQNIPCLKSTDFTDYQKAIELTKDFFEKTKTFGENKLKITIFGENTPDPKEFLKYWGKTNNILYINTIAYYKDSKELEDESIQRQLAYEIGEKYKREAREYLNNLASLIKETSKNRILGEGNQYQVRYFYEDRH